MQTTNTSTKQNTNQTKHVATTYFPPCSISLLLLSIDSLSHTPLNRHSRTTLQLHQLPKQLQP